MGFNVDEYVEYLTNTRSFVLASVGETDQPNLRHIGAYNLEGLDIVFSTNQGSQKIKEFNHNSKVSLLFQKENQDVLKNITVYGEIQKLEGEDLNKAIDSIRQRRPQYNYLEDTSIIYKIETKEIKVLDFSTDERYAQYTRGELD